MPLLPYRIIFVSVLNNQVASHRFRVDKVAQVLRGWGVNVVIMHFHPKLELLFLLKLAIQIYHGQQQCIVVFQKTRAFHAARLAKKMGVVVLYDLDDGGLSRIDGSRYPETIEQELISWTHVIDGLVVSCGELANWCSKYTRKKIHIIPTCVDVENYCSLQKIGADTVRIGWVGSNNTTAFLKPIEQALALCAQNYNYEFLVVGGDIPDLDKAIPLVYQAWRIEMEPEIFGMFDIGIMPLPNNERAKMKAGFKLLQYMAAGLPVVASPIGINRELIRDGWNGFLADNNAEWVAALGRLLNEPDLRKELGRNGKTYVSKHYSIEIAAKKWLEVCEEIVKEPLKPCT